MRRIRNECSVWVGGEERGQVTLSSFGSLSFESQRHRVIGLLVSWGSWRSGVMGLRTFDHNGTGVRGVEGMLHSDGLG